MPLGDTKVILELSWLKEANPTISWNDLTISYPKEPIKGKPTNKVPTIPEQYQDFADVFDKDLVQQLPLH